MFLRRNSVTTMVEVMIHLWVDVDIHTRGNIIRPTSYHFSSFRPLIAFPRRSAPAQRSTRSPYPPAKHGPTPTHSLLQVR